MPTATLTIADEISIKDVSSTAALNTSVSAVQTDIVSTANNSNFTIRQVGDGAIIFAANKSEILRLQDGVITAQMPIQFSSYLTLSMPDASTPGRMIYVSDSKFGSCMAFSDGSNWRRSDDCSIIT